jgi:hypothetical protein
MRIQLVVCLAIATAAVVATVALAGGSKGPGPTQKSTPVVVKTSDGFDWVDAAIGVAAGVGATLAALGAFTLARTS